MGDVGGSPKNRTPHFIHGAPLPTKMVQVQCGSWMFLGCCALALTFYKHPAEYTYSCPGGSCITKTPWAQPPQRMLYALCCSFATSGRPWKLICDNMWQQSSITYNIMDKQGFFLPPRCSLSTRSFLLAWQKPKVCMGMILWAHLPQANMKHFGNSKVCLDAKGWRDGYQPYRRVPGESWGVLGSLGIVGLATESLRSSRARQGRLLHVHRARMIRLVAGQSEGSTIYSLYR